MVHRYRIDQRICYRELVEIYKWLSSRATRFAIKTHPKQTAFFLNPTFFLGIFKKGEDFTYEERGNSDATNRATSVLVHIEATRLGCSYSCFVQRWGTNFRQVSTRGRISSFSRFCGKYRWSGEQPQLPIWRNKNLNFFAFSKNYRIMNENKNFKAAPPSIFKCCKR